MRVISGSAKGRVLFAPKGHRARPTLQHVKESLFNILSRQVGSAVTLDLFAGAGNLGIEALSRGASECVFVDSDSRCTRAIGRNLLLTGLSERARIYRMDVYRAIEFLYRMPSRYDLVFADPPYDKGLELPLLSRLGEGGILAQGGVVVLEHSCRTETPAQIGCLTRDSVRTYGDTHVSLYAISAEGQT